MSEAPRSSALAPAAIALTTFAVYLPSLGGGFVWDDDANFSENTVLQGAGALGRIWRGDIGLQYFPLTQTSLWLQYQLTGLSTWPLHLVNLALHATGAVLVLLVLTRLHVKGAAFAALLFAVHPIQVESVAWITERKNVLSGALVLASALAYLVFDDAHASGTAARRAWTTSLGLFALALLAKSTTAMVPFALAAALVLVKGRRLRDLVPLAPFAALGVAAGVFTAHVERAKLGAEGVDFAWSAPLRVMLAGRAFLFYLGKLAVPWPIMLFYPRWTLDPASPIAWSAALGTLLLSAAAIYAASRGARASLGALLAYGALILPVLGFLNVYVMRFTLVQDHFAYLACIPVFALAAAAIARASARRPRAGIALGAAAIVACGALSATEARAFQDYDTLLLTALARNPAAWVASYNLGYRALQAGQPRLARSYLEQAYAVRPDDADIAGNLGAARARTGDVQDALPLLARATELRPGDVDARLNYAAALVLAGDARGAVASYREAIRLKPAWPRSERELAWLLATTDDTSVRDGRDAVLLATRACAKTTKAVARCQDTLAAAYAAAGQFEEAVTHARAAQEMARAAGDLRAATAYGARGGLYAERKAYVPSGGGASRGQE